MLKLNDRSITVGPIQELEMSYQIVNFFSPQNPIILNLLWSRIKQEMSTSENLKPQYVLHFLLEKWPIIQSSA